MVLKIYYYLFLLYLNTSGAFDAGLLELRPFRDTKEEDTTHYEITVCAVCRVTIDYLKQVYKTNTQALEAKFNETNGQCNGKIINEIVAILSGQSGVNPFQFAAIVRYIASSNTKTDLKEPFSEKSHFDSEAILEGSD
ncbi:unnamed protein product, partial [Didymodactylos carnosus]